MNAKTTPAAEMVELIAPAAGLDIKALAQLGADASAITLSMLAAPAGMVGVPTSIPVALVNGRSPEARGVANLFEPFRQHPARKSGQAVAQTFEAFCELTNRHKTIDSVIFADADWRNPSFTAVIDYHQNAPAGLAAFGKHRVHYAFPLSEEWKKWIEMNGEPMKQAEFAYFLEDRVAELSSPTEHERATFEQQFQTKIATPAQVVELSRGLKINIDTKVKTATTLQSGEGQIAWEEAHNDVDGKPLKVPGLFMLNLAPFFMGEKVRIPVRLRYRPSGAMIMWSYQIYRPDQAINEHVRSTLAEVRSKTDLPAYEGTPEMPA
ncbi:DUF2303 family protein [Mesorhizobium sp. L-2-11]|uniref:DUF2303 family protein n=1 Tax=Mesorhizobium sp. L-2-11 TaxID=2744521 RepID=UPI001935ADF6|nr:DUF2303 family protein [Mesorhizobium sp. L-2-11]BCH20149.1 hypothetical protein MesoLjLa_70000 [Mesorhizobium sp. L-2-11]